MARPLLTRTDTRRTPTKAAMFLLGVAPSDQANTYFDTFSRVRQSVQLMDRGR